MQQIIVIRLHPDKPVSGAAFSSYLTGLTLSAYDLNVGDPQVGQHLGDATFVAPPVATPWLPDPTTTIVQHYTPLLPPPGPTLVPEAEATAVIAISLPAGYKEYVTSDLRLVISRSGTPIVSRLVYYDVQTLTVGALPAPNTYPALGASDVALYLTLPRPLTPGLAQIDLSQGQIPDFATLKSAVETVLAADEGPVPAITALSAAQATHIANEIVWGPQDPLPAPPASSTTGYDDVGALYTNPPNDGTISNQLEQNRQQFEGNLNSYYATHNANVQRLANYVYALSTAMACEAMSTAATQALLTFPVNPGVSSPETTIAEADVLLLQSGGGALSPAFTVPAEYFYALGVLLPLQMTAVQRFQLACRDTPQRTLPTLASAVDNGLISATLTVNPAQAARRMAALAPGAQYDSTAPHCALDATLTPLVHDWLAYPAAAAWRSYQPGDDDSGFWTPEIAAQPAGYLALDLAALTNDFAPLTAAILAIPVASVAQLAALTVANWNHLFGNPPNTALLPPFTAPGTPQARVAAFIRHVQKFFAMGFGLSAPPTAAADAAPTLDLPTEDMIAEWVAAYQTLVGGTFTFGAGPLVDSDVAAAAQNVWPSDTPAQQWLAQRMTVLNALCQLAGVTSHVMPPAPSLTFSVAEALYARGFTSAADIAALSQDSFSDALRGTVAFDSAAAIWNAAGGVNPATPPAPGPFTPINPGGLEDCVPPCYLSPTGTVQYLHDLLALSENASCDAPDAPTDSGRFTLGQMLAGRRADPALLEVTAANALSPLPQIDIVNEQLENLVATSAAGGVYDSAQHALFGHKLCSPDDCLEVIEDTDQCHHPAQLFTAMPQYSSPATPPANGAAYAALGSDFSAPSLPYSQPLDVNRQYLETVSSCRFAVMRAFRQEITEFALDQTVAAPAFPGHLWRYPVKIDIGIEYLGISAEEYAQLFTQNIALTPTPGQLTLYTLYGFVAETQPDGSNWIDVVLRLPEFLRRTGLSYCELVALQDASCVQFDALPQKTDSPPRDANTPPAQRAPGNGDGEQRAGRLPACEPCCPEHYRLVFHQPNNPQTALAFLAVYLRLWRKLQAVCGARYTFAQLCDIIEVLQLYQGGNINPDFIRQLVSFQILRDQFGLRLSDGTAKKGAHGADRSGLLALWVGPSASKWSWAVQHLVERIQHFAQTRIDHCPKHPPTFIKLLTDNLDPLSELVGFSTTLASDSWHALPTHTLRFAEALAKITASRFGIGELLYLYGVAPHLDGDDPFPLQDGNEARDDPLGLPETAAEHDRHGLAALRKKLLAACVDEHEIHAWTWHRIETELKAQFGYAVPVGGKDYLQSLGQHFFPHTLERAGVSLAATDRQYRVPLAATSPDMWNTPPHGPFRYDATASMLTTQLPLTDHAVIDKLSHLRDLSADERQAVQNLYALPRVDLAPFALFFPDFAAAEHHLIAEADEDKRWYWFRAQFALAVKRCHLIAAHLASHVDAVKSAALCAAAEPPAAHASQTAWLILRTLYADENRGLASWENDSGAPPDVMWRPQPSGGAFAALLGLIGTGLVGEFHGQGGSLVWREPTADLQAFGAERNAKNAPVPTIVPALDLSLSPEQLKLFGVRNGFGMQNQHGTALGGVEGFSVQWRGVLLIDEAGHYHFSADTPHHDCGGVPERRWRVRLARGQKTWTVVSHRWPHEHSENESSLPLLAGAYDIEVAFWQSKPEFAGADDVHPLATGFVVKYAGADTHGQLVALPLKHLFSASKDAPLGDKLPLAPDSAAAAYLALRYTSSLRDIRRTYQRAFKALLLAHRFTLSGHPLQPFGQSELGYLLAHADLFAGVSFYRNPAFTRHAVYFDMNLLPLFDPYLPPPASQDQRVAPSNQRRQAWFDNWERLFDYTRMRAPGAAAGRHAWLLFEEAAEKQPDNPAQLLRHLAIDLDWSPCVQSYFTSQTTPVYPVSSLDLCDDRWAVRVWRAGQWIEHLVRHFPPNDIRRARPDLWASDDPGAVVPGETQTGNVNLARLVEDALIEPDEPDLRRYDDLRRLNDGLRAAARAHLLAYLCGMNRVALPWGGFATDPAALSALLLIDVETGCCEQASRIEQAISAAQTFVERARLGLEDWVLGAGFLRLWQHEFASYPVWKDCHCRTLYRENWIGWDERRKARRIEAFQLLEDQLRRSALSLAAPGGLAYWPEALPPAHPAIRLLQQCEPSALRRLVPPREGLGVLGTPERTARPSWLAPDTGATPNNPLPPPTANGLSAVPPAPATSGDGKLPFWIQAAIRLGVHFIRVAAGGVPPAAAAFVPGDFHPEPSCCNECAEPHPPWVDEYYFWLVPARVFNAPEQDSYYDPSQQASAYWHDPTQLPTLLHWDTDAAVRLAWCRVHNGDFQQPRHSSAPVSLTAGATPDLTYVGRSADSLTFAVSGGVASIGYNGSAAPGFRYDMAADDSLPLPLVADPSPVASPYPAGLPAYPYFLFVEPGERLFIDVLFSPARLMAEALRCHCRFEPALKWYQLVRNPLEADNTWMVCGGQHNPGTTDETSTEARRLPPPNFCCDSTHITEQAARERAIVLDYLDTLVEWARARLRDNSRESAEQARLILDTAAMILGPCPAIVHNHVRPAKQQVGGFVPLNPPLNPRLMQLYGQVRDGRMRVHRCLSEWRLVEPNAKVAPYWGETACCCEAAPAHPCDEAACCGEWGGCHPSTPYRFNVLLPKAVECVGRLRELGTGLLNAFERGDSEYLAQMHARHETALADMSIALRQQQWREADWQLQALRVSKEVQQTNRRYYKRLIDVGLISGELDYQDNMNNNIALHGAAIEIEAVAEAMALIPDLFVGFPCEETWLPIGTKLSGMFKTLAHITSEVGEIAGLNGQLDLTQAGWQRRLDEWVHQVEVLDLEIEQLELQILAAERKSQETLIELNLQQQTLEQSRETLDTLRDKFTSQALWLYLQKEGMALYWQTYELSMQLARQTQHAFNFELGYCRRNFLPCDSWDNLREGLLAGEKLNVALERMQQAYLQDNRREYELTKHVSLALQFPLPFLRLKLTGYCEIELPEWLFDLDYPGQYMRRLKSVSLTLPCVTGPYSGVHCKLTLLSSWTRVDPSLPCPTTPCCRDQPKCDCGCRHPRHEHYRADCCDPRGVKLYGAREAIATSSGRNDAGLFELNFHDERHLPFEYAGAVSRWRIELPPENNYFDLASLTDVVMHLNYTAREGGSALRDAAREAARERLPGDGWIYLDLQRDFPDAWEQWQRTRRHAGEACDGGAITLPITRKLFPYLPGDPSIEITKIAVLFDSDHCAEPPCPPIDDCPCATPDARGCHVVEVTVDRQDDDCAGRELALACKPSIDWPTLYHGSGEMRLAPLDGCHPGHRLTLSFADRVDGMARMFVLCRYQVICHCCDTERPPRHFDVHEGGCHDCA
ncbi:neuraminidase-like domain-containing protein [Paludibacterium sp.]|uniref:Tc toxin subunit A-related protein n=1 Tax=Paludibacterium sp. TaxID=1917523 RepID=UPI0025E838D9|nr:neuraminidase-like domain-containing protein [Paludibacterium sp.]MBV8648832.1 hypothetical protein [Paludibacterium sp.]